MAVVVERVEVGVYVDGRRHVACVVAKSVGIVDLEHPVGVEVD